MEKETEKWRKTERNKGMKKAIEREMERVTEKEESNGGGRINEV